jgi:non-lysosomal glucosylceramidase
MYGVPCGGVGSGTIGRGTTGEFTRFQISPGMYSYETVCADAFHVCVRDKADKVVFQSVLQSKRNVVVFELQCTLL